MFFNLGKSSVRFLFFSFIFLFAVNFISAQSSNTVKSAAAIELNLIKPNQRQTPEISTKTDYAKVAADLERELPLYPQDATLHNNLGTAYARTARYEEALKAIQKAIEIEPDNASFYLNLSVVYDTLNRRDEALTAARRAIELTPDDIEVNQQFCELNVLAEQFETAASCYKNLLRLTPKDAKSATGYSIALFNLKKFSEALKVMEDATQTFPENPYVQNMLGLILCSKKNYKKAINAFNRAVELDSKYDAARYNLAVALLAIKDKSAALEQYFMIKNSNQTYAEKLYRILYSDKLVFVENK